MPQFTFMQCLEILTFFKSKDDYLGTVIAHPTAIVSAHSPLASLQWYTIIRHGENAGELLAAFEMIKVNRKV